MNETQACDFDSGGGGGVTGHSWDSYRRSCALFLGPYASATRSPKPSRKLPLNVCARGHAVHLSDTGPVQAGKKKCRVSQA